MEKLKKKVTIVLMAIMMTMVFFADAQAKAGCNHKHTGRTWIIAEKANCNHTGRKKQLCVRCRKVLLEKGQNTNGNLPERGEQDMTV